MKKYYTVLSIAGSDPSGGAGIQADIKSISACGCFATTAITAVVDENTLGVYGIHPIPVNFVHGQIRSVLSDIGADAVKIGMLHSSELISSLKEILLDFGMKNIVIDPVMAATSGGKLLLPEAISALKMELIPICTIITPNIPEAEILSGEKITSLNDMCKIAEQLAKEYGISVLLKGGHLGTAKITDVLFNYETNKMITLESDYIDSKNKHGTGCSLSSALASFLAQGLDLDAAVKRAKNYINHAIEQGAEYQIGEGNGSIHHFYNYWK